MRGRWVGVGLVTMLLWPAAAHAKPVPLRSGSVEIAFDVDFGLKLVTNGITPGPIAPATQEGLTVTLPLRRGSQVRTDQNRATIQTAGGLSQKATNLDILLGTPRLIIRGRKAKLSALTSVNGLETDRFNFATGTAETARRTAGGYIVRKLELKLNDIGAGTLNSQLRTSDFAIGETLGIAKVTARR